MNSYSLNINVYSKQVYRRTKEMIETVLKLSIVKLLSKLAVVCYMPFPKFQFKHGIDFAIDNSDDNNNNFENDNSEENFGHFKESRNF